MIFVLGLLIIVGGLLASAYGNLVMRENVLQLHPRTRKPRVAVLIPARDESAVIRGLLKSLLSQTHKVSPKDVYVIVESRLDPTVAICKKLGVQIFVRTNLKHQRKGYALDEVTKYILSKNRHYDVYFIFDADNILSKDYLEKILESYYQGYDIATGYRAAKNANDNVIAAVSSLTFSMINILGNRERIKHNTNVIFSGTGCFVVGDLIEKWQGWPFHSLTEDYEMSLYATRYGLATTYNEAAVFYDEQPTKYVQTVAQRTRWIKGYFSARQKYIPKLRKVKRAHNLGSIKKEIIGVKPIVTILVGVILIFLFGIIKTVSMGDWSWVWLALTILLIVYLALMLVTVIILKRERLRLRAGMLWRVILFNPIFLISFVDCALRALLTKNVTWQKIEHHQNKVDRR